MAWDIGNEGQWSWIGQIQSGQQWLNYSNWDPNHVGGAREENCAIIRSSDALWVDVPCGFGAMSCSTLPICRNFKNAVIITKLFFRISNQVA